jgi:hypothetical protein
VWRAAFATIALAGLASAGAQAATTQAASKPAAGKARGTTCANPWRVVYANGKVTGDTREVALKVTIVGSKITIAWHAQPGYSFCQVTMTEGRGQVFASTNPSSSYTYTDTTKNHSNGIKSLVATARNPRKPAAR